MSMVKIKDLPDLNRSYISYGDRDCMEIARMKICTGDIVEIGLGRNKYFGEFKGFNQFMMAFSIKTDEGEMLVPYKNVKYIRVLERAKKEGEGNERGES